MRAPFVVVVVVGSVLAGCGTSNPPEALDAASADGATDVAAESAADVSVDRCAIVDCETGKLCDPIDGACKPPKNDAIGASCGAAACPGGTCLDAASGFTDGYCVVEPCSEAEACPIGSACVKLGGKQACFLACAIDADCRGGTDYKCHDVASLRVGTGADKVCYLPAIPCATNADCPSPLGCAATKTCAEPS